MLMKKIFYLYSKSLLSKLALMAILIVGEGNSAWADTVLFNSSNQAVTSGWSYTRFYNNSVTPGNLSSSSSYNLLNYNATTGYSWYTSTSQITITSGQTIEISAKKYGTSPSYPEISVQYSTDSENWTTIKTFNPSDNTNYTTFKVSEGLVGTRYIRFQFLYVYIQSITLKDPEVITTPILSITHPNDGDAFGFVTTNTTKTYTVENTGTSSMDVNITSDSEAFTVSTSSLTGITNDGTGKTFNVTFNYDASAPGQHSANITITPTFEGAVAEVIEVTAGPEVEINEDKATIWTTGSGKNVYVKYTAVNGWNTICMPISPNTYKTQLYGSSATVQHYTLNDYNSETGTLTFKSAPYPGSGTPYLVYVKDAASAPFIINNMYFGGVSASNTVAGTAPNKATLHGTYTPITAGNFTTSMYGVTSSGQVRPGDGVNANMKGYRAYFTGVSAPSTPGARISIVFEDDGETTDLGFVKMVDPEATDVYTLSGQKVKKGSKGIYIVNGRKVVIK